MLNFRRAGLAILLAGAVLVFALSATEAKGQADTAIPPVILQGCAPKVKPARFGLFGNRNSVSAAGHGEQAVGFDVSFVNTTQKVATLVVIRIGDTDFVKTGTFSPGVVIAWRLAAQTGACSVRAVRFADGSEWTAP